MTILDGILEDNKKFVENFEGEEMSHHAQKKLAILTCMDCRLIDFFEPALGLKRGDAKIVRNAGNSIVGEDAIRSIGAALYNLGAEEVLVVGQEALKRKTLQNMTWQNGLVDLNLKRQMCLMLLTRLKIIH